MNPLNVLLVGIGGMGQAVEAELLARQHNVADRVDIQGDSRGRSLEQVVADESFNVAIEFTLPNSAAGNVHTLLNAGIPVVSGTTGWEPASLSDLSVETNTPFLHSANFSIGVAVMKKLAAVATESFKPFPDFEPAIFERHHNRKKDAPSGTARMLGDVIKENNNHRDLQITSVRQGGVAGEHTLIFEGEAESLEIVHRAHSRRIFAIGTVRAAEWLVRERPTGLVTFDTFLERTLKWEVNA